MLVCPGSPLLDSSWTSCWSAPDILKRGPCSWMSTTTGRASLLFYMEHAVMDGRLAQRGEHQVVSTRMQFVEVRSDGRSRTRALLLISTAGLHLRPRDRARHGA